MSGTKSKYQLACEACDAAWEANEAAGFTPESSLAYRTAYGKKLMAHAEQRKAIKEQQTAPAV